MSYNLTINSIAESDIEEAALYYAGQRQVLGSDFLAAASEILFLLETNPHLFAVKQYGIRSAKIKPFAYHVIYTIADSDVKVIGVLHEGRNPDAWKTRL